ncbi:MAG TPA: glutathione S-transferase C-terminal domain-containing protein [Kofleriaceae bacterium]
MTIEFVEVAAAKARTTEIRVVVTGLVPSPWQEATKGLFRLARIPIVAVRTMPRDREIAAWTGVDNVPVVLNGDEPARSSWSAIVGLVARLAPGAVLPEEPAARAAAMGSIEMIAGEDGIGWNGRLAMIHGGFGEPARSYLAKRYGYTPAAVDGARERVAARLAVLAAQLGGRDYFGGGQPNAVDVYAATFLTPLFPIGEADCPQLAPPLRAAFAAAADTFGALVPASLAALRARMFERHLAWPIEL